MLDDINSVGLLERTLKRRDVPSQGTNSKALRKLRSIPSELGRLQVVNDAALAYGLCKLGKDGSIVLEPSDPEITNVELVPL